MQNLPVAVGDCVRVRRQRWRVVDVRPYQDCRLLALRGTGPVNLNIERRVLQPFDAVEPARHRRRVRFVGSRRWRQQCRRLIASHGGADALRTARTARIELLPHQLEPALAIVRGLTSRVLIADDVGLGKTIQAGLIVSELVLRAAAERVLILTPAGLREQWTGELSDRFGLACSLVDTAAIQRRRAMLRPDVNPWSTIPIAVASIDYVKRPEVLPAVESCRWDLIIVDEAHGSIRGSDRHDAVSLLAACAPYVVLLTATPHNGDADAFASLRAIGDQRDPLLIFRRTRRDVGMPTDRRVRRLVVRPSDAEREMHARLDRFSEAVRADQSERGVDTSLALATLHKRALSSAFALHETVRRRLLSLDGSGAPSEHQLPLPLDGEPGEDDDGDAAPGWTCPALHDPAAERALLVAVTDAARAAFPVQAKLDALEKLIRRIGEPMVIFTEYRDTLLHVRSRVFPGALVIHGGLSRAERRDALAAFQRGDRTVLMATDAAGEGLNLQRTCRVVINLELPWNPMRLEQRIGRIDRIGQGRRVHAVHLIAAGTREVGLVERLQRRLAAARRDVGAPEPLGHSIEHRENSARTVRIDAALEYRRLVQARQLTASPRNRPTDRYPGRLWRGGEELVDTDTLVSLPRTAIRARIGSRPLAIVGVMVTDDNGRIIAHDVRGMLLATSSRAAPCSRPQKRALIAAVEALASDPGGSDRAAWSQAAVAVHAAFWTRRLARERSIRQALAARLHSLHQPGLFGKSGSEARADLSTRGDGTVHIRQAERMQIVTVSPEIVHLLLLR